MTTQVYKLRACTHPTHVYRIRVHSPEIWEKIDHALALYCVDYPDYPQGVMVIDHLDDNGMKQIATVLTLAQFRSVIASVDRLVAKSIRQKPDAN
jgi:hypothetical protein